MFATWPRRDRLIAGGLGIAAVAVLAVVLVLLTGSAPADRSANGQARRSTPSALPVGSRTASSSPTRIVPSPPRPFSARALPPLPRTDDPTVYARDVATVLFGVDTASVTRNEFLQFWQGELPTVVYSDAASKGLTLAVQNGDVLDNLIGAWIPTRAAWDSEAADKTTNRFVITSVSVPDYWVNAVADGTFRDPGLRMERVMGVLTQTYGADPARRYTSARSVVIDLGLLCGPTQPGGCQLLAPQQPPGSGDS